ncbi:oxaloacetate decarboxylase subunit gamma [Psychromonas antarctica]|uniref:oxaloacetate decarboxylase subunit gamma n=1 Tax=Psychromonas antarctica TaxID=67573 RepID=UPI001EE83425|nr:oxaloacetate decarboxylase subunit gamma [Psychromonas antarctica]MCG6200550.1 oxaloacetate decarboxylase subunit gamma [Psychromonas antarctica]
MNITESLLKALTLLGLGMTFVFLFLGLLMVAVSLMAKYIPADEPVVNKNALKRKTVAPVSTQQGVNPTLIAAITSAVQQYRKTEVV